ncbi:MAG: rane protein major facilitator superfamily [Pedosphaera sp.]|nr:rane protein major facilitator superfamily [Pedosphaera sp.]
MLGCGVGYWALIVTNAAEQFGTNLRATVTTAIPSLVRGALIPISAIFTLVREPLGLVNGAALVGILCVFGALIATLLTKETFGHSLDYVEEE